MAKPGDHDSNRPVFDIRTAAEPMNDPAESSAAPGVRIGRQSRMRLQDRTWREVEDYLGTSQAIIIPTGSTEQHGPIGIIGTDSVCAESIAGAVGDCVGALVAPTISFSPAPFNLSFPGTISIPEDAFAELVREIIRSLHSQGFASFYFLNGHGANLRPLNAVDVSDLENARIRVRNWWEFPETMSLRQELYGDWEGMHATPSEISVTQAVGRVISADDVPESLTQPERLSQEFIRACAGDRHGPPDEHRARFPDGRVGSHSALACPDHGFELVKTAVTEIAEDFLRFAGPAPDGKLRDGMPT